MLHLNYLSYGHLVILYLFHYFYFLEKCLLLYLIRRFRSVFTAGHEKKTNNNRLAFGLLYLKMYNLHYWFLTDSLHVQFVLLLCYFIKQDFG